MAQADIRIDNRGPWGLAIGIVLAAVIFGWFLHSSRSVQDSIRVVGSTSKRVESDIIKWRLTIARMATEQGVTEGYRLLHQDVQSTIARLKDAGVADDQITIQAINAYPMYARDGMQSGRNITQSVLVISPRVSEIEKLGVDPRSILGSGVVLENSHLEYFHSDLATIKRELLRDAMIDARARADVLAEASGVSIAGLQNASVGVFQITEPFSTEVSDYGMYTTSTRQKDITVTVRASFLVR